MTKPQDFRRPPRGRGPAPDQISVALRDLTQRAEQVRTALAAESRALDDRTLSQMLDTTEARLALGGGTGDEGDS